VDRADFEGQTILVMEEEVLIALELRVVLERAGAQVHVVRNAGGSIGLPRQIGFHSCGDRLAACVRPIHRRM
jgi:hypothetical protein